MRDDMVFYAQLPRLLRGSLAQLPFEQVLKVLALTLVWQVANAAGFFYEGYWPSSPAVRSKNADDSASKRNDVRSRRTL